MRDRLASIYEIEGISRGQRNLPMEGLRGFAVILVFFVHHHSLLNPATNTSSFTGALSAFLATIGHSGVDLFFVLSGYLIYGALVKKNINYRSFIKRRVERIYPTFVVVFAMYLALSVLYPENNKIPAGPLRAGVYILQNILLLPGLLDIEPLISVAWSLSYEFFYYLSIPLLVTALRMRQWASGYRMLFFGLMALFYTVYCFCFVGFYAYIRMIMFISGILLYEFEHYHRPVCPATAAIDYCGVAALMVTFPLIYLFSDRPEFFPHWLRAENFGAFHRIIVLFVTFFLFMHACFSSQGLLNKLFSWRPLRWLGNMSYSYYLIHGLTLHVVRLFVTRLPVYKDHSLVVFWIGLPLAFFLTLVTSTCLFILIERRFSLTGVWVKPTLHA